jgi:colanic acid/amylovoran biosynthesis glycosyltransferase
MTPTATPLPTAAQFVPQWLPLTQGWIYTQIKNLPPDEFQSLVFCNDRLPGNAFPLDSLVVMRRPREWSYLRGSIIRKTLNERHLPHFLRELRSRPITILHSHFGNSAWRNVPTAVAAGLPHVCTFYGYDATMLPQKYPIWQRRFLDLFQSIDRVLCEGPAFAATLMKLGCPADRVTVHPLGLELEYLPFSPVSWDGHSAVRFLLAGRFVEKKGFRYAIEAIAQIARQLPVALTLVGGPEATAESREEQAAMERVVASGGLESRIKRIGFLPISELRHQICDHHFFMAPSVTAASGDCEGGAPVTAIEAQALGVPVISSTHCDLPFVLNQGAILSGERDVPALVAQIESWLNQPKSWRERLESGRAHVEDRFNARVQGQRLAQIYHKTLTARP